MERGKQLHIGGRSLFLSYCFSIGAWIAKIVDAKPFRRDHFYLGIDLTVYFLATVVVNFLDVAKQQPIKDVSIEWTVCLLMIALFMLLFQMGVHQTWQGEAKRGKMQSFVLCYVSNFLGMATLYWFVFLKRKGLV